MKTSPKTIEKTDTKNKYTQSLLVKLRNTIPIKWIIFEKLKIEAHFDRIWRFKCPLCKDFNTAIKKETNLSRCFTCQQNFNPIDIVINQKKYEFVESVEYLLPYLDKFTKNINMDERNKKLHEKQKAKGREEIATIKKLLRN
jgi:phage FluMu protein Com